MNSPFVMSAPGLAVSGWGASMGVAGSYMSFTVAPEAARPVYQYGFGGENLLYTDTEKRGHTFAAAVHREGFVNYGGARMDVAPQSQWRETPHGRDWPPPLVLTSTRDLSGDIRTGFNLIAESDRSVLGLALSTNVLPIPSSSLIRLTGHMKNLADHDQIWANWLVVQLLAAANQGQVIIPPSATSRFDLGYKVLMGDPRFVMPKPIDTRAHGAALSYTGTEVKFGFDGRRWIAFRPSESGDTIFALQINLDARAKYPDGGSSTQCYMAGHAPYVELEGMGPLTVLRPGASRSDDFLIGAARFSGDVTDISPIGITGKPLRLRDKTLTGTFGVFYGGTAKVMKNSGGKDEEITQMPASPLSPLCIAVGVKAPSSNDEYKVVIHDDDGRQIGTLASTW